LSPSTDTQVTATFTQQTQQVALTVEVAGAGSGSVRAEDGEVLCHSDEGVCETSVDLGSAVTLSGIPDPGYIFAGWSGAGCVGAGVCEITLNQAGSVKAVFVMVVFNSSRKLDGTDAVETNFTSNIWFVNTDGTGLTPLTTATAAGAHSENPQWSPDGERVVFSSTRKIDGTDAANTNGTSNVWVAEADGTGLAALTTVTANQVVNSNPQWSPDGSRIVFASNRKLDGTDAANTNGTLNIWVINADGTGLTALTTATVDIADSFHPHNWSPDGTKIAFVSRLKLDGTDAVNTNSTNNIWVINADGSGLNPLTTTTALGSGNNNTRWSPDGTKVLFDSDRKLDGTDAAGPNGTRNIWVINADGTGLAPLTTATATDAGSFEGQWSPDGTRIAFYSSRKLDGTDAANTNDTLNIWVINADGSGLMPLTTATAAATDSELPNWTPDGEHVVFDSSRKVDGSNAANTNGIFNIWWVNSDGTGLTALTTATAANSFEPQASP
jgi:Tol biopolymer transport system component